MRQRNSFVERRFTIEAYILTMMATMIGKIKWVSLVSSVIITVRAMVIRATPAKKPFS